MSRKLAACVLVATLAWGGAASADEPKVPQAPPPPPAAAAVTPAVVAPPAAPTGAIVVAAWDGAGPAAHALAFDVYRDADLRPSIDDATARVLAGDAPPDGAPPRLKELAELRASIARSYAAPAPQGAPPSDLVTRRLLASLGTELNASLVVAVGMDGSRPVARVLRTSTSAFERIELGPTVDIATDGARTFRWPGATSTIHAILVPPPPPADPAPPPLVPRVETKDAPATPGDRPFYKSPWFWGSVGGAVAVGLSVFLISRATSSASNVHLTGKITP